MAFTINNLGRVSTSANEDALKVWTYNGTSTGTNETLATITASAYFNSFQQNLTSGSEAGPLQVGDIIEVSGNDAAGAYTVSSITTNVTLVVRSSNLLMQYASVAITAAEFNGMYAAPKLLLAAQGANTLITLHRAELLMTYGAAQYAAGGVAAIQYDSTVNGAGIIASTTQAAADFADAVSTANAFEGGVVKQPFSTCVNKGLYLSNITQAFTTGDSAMVMHLWYSVVATA
jgi:hypothetical protein